MDDMIEQDDVMIEAQPLEELGADYAFPSDTEIVKVCGERIAKMNDHWKPLFRASKDDFAVYNGDQWTSEAKGKRGKRIKVTDDFTAPYIEFVIASTFENPTTFKIAAKEDTARLKTKALAEALRYYENFGESKEAKSWALECAAVGGFGYYKAVYDLRDAENGGSPTIGIEQVANPFSILLDENSMKLDGSDANYLVEYLDTSKDHYTYYWRDEKDKSIVLWAEIKDGEVKAKDVYPASGIPIVPVYGRLSNVDGKTVIQGLIRVIKDKQREWNWIKSDALERIATTPTATTFVAAGSLNKNNKRKMAKSFKEPVNYVEVNPITTSTEEDKTGTQLMFPQRANTSPDLSYVQSQLDQITESVKTSTGIYNTAMGQEATGVESGVAIDRKTQNSNRGILRYDAHSKISDAWMGRIQLDLIQNVIAPTGELPIENEKGERMTILVGQPPMNEFGEQMLPRDEEGNVLPFIEDADVTDADISITTQPAYATRKEEGVAKVIEFMGKMSEEDQGKLVPQLIEDIDFPGSSKYAGILRGTNEQSDPAQAMQQIQELNAQIEQGSAQLEQSQEMIENLNNQNMQLQMKIQNNAELELAKTRLVEENKYRMKQDEILSRERIAGMQVTQTQIIHGDNQELDYAKELNKKEMNDDKLEAERIKQNKQLVTDTMKDINTNIDSLGYDPLA